MKLQGKLTFERLRTSSGWPKLKAKAAAIRHLSKFGLAMALRYNSGSIHDKQRLAVITLLCKFYNILDREGELLSASAKDEISRLGKRLFGCYIALNKEALLANAK